MLWLARARFWLIDVPARIVTVVLWVWAIFGNILFVMVLLLLVWWWLTGAH